jgi:hypothetical protein
MVFCLYRYVKALGILFDPSTSTVELQSIAVTGPRTVEANWTLGGTLLLPWHPSIRRFHGAPSAATVLLVGLQGSAQLVRFEMGRSCSLRHRGSCVSTAINEGGHPPCRPAQVSGISECDQLPHINMRCSCGPT